MDGRFDAAMDFIRSRGGQQIAHVHGDLLSHLQGTEALLKSWGSSEELRLAGLCHAAYGTDGLRKSLLDVSDRATLQKVIGIHAEETVYFYASCDRGFLYPKIGRAEPTLFRDRFTGSVRPAEQAMMRDFLELTFANELELATADRGFAHVVNLAFGDLFARCKPFVSGAAFNHFVELCSP